MAESGKIKPDQDPLGGMQNVSVISVADFFISYNKADRPWAEWIAWQLESAGYSTVLQAWDFRPGGNFVLDMEKASAECSRTIALLSPDYITAQFTQPEWAAAFAKDPSGQLRTLVMVKVRDCNVEGLLAQITHINLVGLTEPIARNELLSGVRVERAKPGIPPLFPGAVADTVSPTKPPYPGTGRNDLIIRDASDALCERIITMHKSARQLTLSVHRDQALIALIDTGLAEGRPDLITDYVRELSLSIQRDEQYKRIIEAHIEKGQFEHAQSLVLRCINKLTYIAG